jgi:uncharacterized protein YggE
MRQSWIFYLLALVTWAAPAHAQPQARDPGKGAILTVRGQSRVEMKPDYARLRATVSTKAPSLEEAARAHQDRATRALAILKDVSAEGIDIEQSTFSLGQDQPVGVPAAARSAERKQPPLSFRAKTEFLLKMNAIDSLNTVMTKLSLSGLFEVFSAYFGVKDERAALNQARRQAVADAREQAAAYADAAGLQLVEIVAITDGEASPSPDGKADLPLTRFVQIIPPRTVAFDAAVNITWRIAPR